MGKPHLILQPPRGEIHSGGFFYNQKICDASEGCIKICEVEDLERVLAQLKNYSEAVIVDSLFLGMPGVLPAKSYFLAHFLDDFEPNPRLSEFAGLITTSEFMSDSLQGAYPNIFTCPPGRPDLPVAAPKRRRLNESFKLLTVANIIPRKGILDGIEAMVDRDGDWRWHIVGSLTMNKNYADKCCRAAANDPRIKFTGNLDHQQTGQQYQQADGFLLPTRFEPFGMVFQEAMHFCLPIVAPAIGAIPQITRGWSDAYLYEKDGLSDALGEMLAEGKKVVVGTEPHYAKTWQQRAAALVGYLDDAADQKTD